MRKNRSAGDDEYYGYLRILLEEICCDMCRIRHVEQDQIDPEDIHIKQEVSLGMPGAFADIEVKVGDDAPYFVEVKYGHRPDKIVRLLSRKYGIETPATHNASKVVLVVDSQNHQDWAAIEADLQKHLRPGLPLEVWGEHQLLSMIRRLFKTEIASLTEESLINLINVVERVKGESPESILRFLDSARRISTRSSVSRPNSEDTPIASNLLSPGLPAQTREIYDNR